MKEVKHIKFLPSSPMGMGSCFGYCLKRDTRPPCTIYFNGNNVVEFDNLVDNMETLYEEPQRTRFQGLSALLSLRRAERTPTQRLFLEMAETRQRDNSRLCLLHTSNESLQILDARVLASRVVSSQLPDSTRPSTPASFIELEWELEGVSGIEAMTSSVGSPGAHASTTQCSRVSSPPSLEWDLVDCELVVSPPPPPDDTEQLISEIERLTQRALQETGLSLSNQL